MVFEYLLECKYLHAAAKPSPPEYYYLIERRARGRIFFIQ